MAAGRDAVDRNSDGSYDAVHSGFGKDYHGQDVFGERIGGRDLGAIGGGKFGGFAAGHVGLDEDNTGHYEKLSYGDIAQTEPMSKSAFEADNSNESSEEEADSMKESLRDLNSESSEENSNVGSLDTNFQIGGVEEDLEKARQKVDRFKEAYDEFKETRKSLEQNIKDIKPSDAVTATALDKLGLGAGYLEDKLYPGLADMKDNLNKMADYCGIEHEDFSNVRVKDLNKVTSELLDEMDKRFQDKVQAAQSDYDTLKSSFTDKVESESTSKAKASSTPSKVIEEAVKGPGKNMSNAKTSPSDYLTKANKDSTKELPKEAPSRNDFGNHAVDTLKGVVDRVADSTTAEALGIQSLEDFAKEKGVDPDKFSTMKAYRIYQNMQIMKALPNLMKKTVSYITERIKDFLDPSQLPERVRNTLARYNAATLIGAAILSIQSGAGLQASIDQALTMVDPADQPDVSDFLEDVLNDEGTVADLSNAFDDALDPEQTSNTEELDESIVNIGRKDNTDYSGFNAGLGTSGTTSDADVKVFIARNVKSDPILRRMISKMGK